MIPRAFIRRAFILLTILLGFGIVSTSITIDNFDDAQALYASANTGESACLGSLLPRPQCLPNDLRRLTRTRAHAA